MNSQLTHYTPPHFTALANSFPQLSWITDPQGKLLWFNRQWYDYTGLTPEQSLNNGWRQAHQPDHLNKTLHIWKAAMTTGKVYEVTHQLCRHDGVYRWFLTRAVPTRDKSGKIISWIGTCTDIEETKQIQNELILAKENLERANQLKTTFLANMSHEIRTPLASIMGFAEILKENRLSQIDKDRFLEMIINNGACLSRIINDILDLSKVESGHLEVENTDMAFDHLLYEILDLFREKANTKKIYLSLDLESHVPTSIKSDPVRIRQILINLIDNAIKFTKDGGVKIEIQSENLTNDLCKFQILVRDTGIGLTPEQRKKLFHPFTQADNSTTRKYGGTGLGLTLSKRLAQALGGDIQILQTQVGVGTVFTFDFVAQSAVDENRFKIPENTHPLITLDLKNTRVLLAEDSRDSQEVIKHVLTNHGAAVCVANDGSEALQLARTKEFDAILMDIQMPEMDGYEVTRILRLEKFKKPIIALTAHAMLEERQRTKAAGFDAHVTKPLNFRQLLSTIYYTTQRNFKN